LDQAQKQGSACASREGTVAEAMRSVIEVEHLEKRYGSTVAVKDVSFEVQQGEIFGIIGPNGAGKTTTVECLEGLRSPDAGMVRVLGPDPQRNPRELRRRIGCQLQESAPDRIRVREALDLFASVVPSEADPRTLMSRWELDGRAKTPFGALSGGQQQRLFVALALANNPEVVFLDEITQGLDPVARRIAWDLIREIREEGATVVLVTHCMDEAERLCDRLAVVTDGRVVAIDGPQGLIARFGGGARVLFSTGHRDVSWLEGVPNVEKVVRDGMRVEVTGSGPLLARVAASLVSRGILPEDLRVERASLEDVFLLMTGSDPERDA
jgi:ABC-2 type transport system ATP-binding protein